MPRRHGVHEWQLPAEPRRLPNISLRHRERCDVAHPLPRLPAFNCTNPALNAYTLVWGSHAEFSLNVRYRVRASAERCCPSLLHHVVPMELLLCQLRRRLYVGSGLRLGDVRLVRVRTGDAPTDVYRVNTVRLVRPCVSQDNLDADVQQRAYTGAYPEQLFHANLHHHHKVRPRTLALFQRRGCTQTEALDEVGPSLPFSRAANSTRLHSPRKPSPSSTRTWCTITAGCVCLFTRKRSNMLQSATNRLAYRARIVPKHTRFPSVPIATALAPPTGTSAPTWAALTLPSAWQPFHPATLPAMFY